MQFKQFFVRNARSSKFNYMSLSWEIWIVPQIRTKRDPWQSKCHIFGGGSSGRTQTARGKPSPGQFKPREKRKLNWSSTWRNTVSWAKQPTLCANGGYNCDLTSDRLRFEFDRCSTPIRLQFDRATTLRCGQPVPGCRTAT